MPIIAAAVPIIFTTENLEDNDVSFEPVAALFAEELVFEVG